jgi:hypothetical protein
MLNEAQERSIHIVMRLIEEKMKSVERLLEQGDQQGVTFQVTQDLTPDMVRTLHATVPEVYALLKEICERFSLAAEIKPVSREVLKGLPELWVMLEESDSRNLGRYGDVDPRVGPLLDPAVQKLGNLMFQLQHLLLPNNGAEQHATEAQHQAEANRTVER